MCMRAEAVVPRGVEVDALLERQRRRTGSPVAVSWASTSRYAHRVALEPEQQAEPRAACACTRTVQPGPLEDRAGAPGRTPPRARREPRVEVRVGRLRRGTRGRPGSARGGRCTSRCGPPGPSGATADITSRLPTNALSAVPPPSVLPSVVMSGRHAVLRLGAADARSGTRTGPRRRSAPRRAASVSSRAASR